MAFCNARREVACCRQPLLSPLLSPDLAFGLLEVECQTSRRRPDLCTADDLVGGITAADLVAMTARPETIMRAWTLVELLLGRGYVPSYPFVEGVQLKVAEAIIEAIAAANLRGPFVVNACHDRGTIAEQDGPRNKIRRVKLSVVVAATVGALVELIGRDRRERTVLVVQCRAIGIAVGAVGAAVAADIAVGRAAGARKIAAAAANRRAVTLKIITVGVVAVVLGIVLTRRSQRAELEAA